MSEDTPTHAPAHEQEKLEKDGKLYLPVAHPLIYQPKQGSIGDHINRIWSMGHFFVRGIYGTFVEWGVSLLDLALEYPKVAVATIAMSLLVLEETNNDHPILEGTFEYVLYTLDPDAARLIFPPDADPSNADQIIDKIAADILTKSAEEYYASKEYNELSLRVQDELHQKVHAALYRMSGITPEPTQEGEPVQSSREDAGEL